MKIIIDSREKKIEHIKRYFDENNISYEIKKLDVGDFQLVDNLSTVVDRKQNLEELSKNLMNKKDKSRFWKEVRRARRGGIKLFLLVEHGEGITQISDIEKWRDAHSGVTGRVLMDEIYKIQVAYGVDFLFCEKKDTARMIISILSGEKK